MGLILILILLGYISGNIYIYIRAMQATASAPLAIKIIFGLLFWLSAAMLFIAMSLRHGNIPKTLTSIMFNVGSSWLVIVLYMTITLAITDIVRHLLLPDMRYGFFYALAATLMLLAYGHIKYLHPRINRIEITLDKPIEGGSMTIAAVSDIHLGYGTGKKRLSHFVEMINNEKPDAILIGGDLVDNSLQPLYDEKMSDEFEKLQAPMGIYMSPGNHEYISDIEESKQFLALTPIKLLFDSVVTLPNGMQIICRDDKSNRQRLPLDKLLEKADISRPTILIDHQPYEIARKDSAGIDIQFSGHTHNGQIWPGNIITDILFEQSHGYRKWNHSHVYVSSGISLWGPPFRIGTSCDMVIFKIKGRRTDK